MGDLDSDESPASTKRESHGIRAEPSFLAKRRKYNVIDSNQDVTPEDIIDSNYAVMSDAFQQAAYDSSTRAKDEAQLKIELSRSRTSTLVETPGNAKVIATTINLDDIHIDHTLNTEEGLIDYNAGLEQAPSAFYLPKMNPLSSYPQEINILLKETPTCFLFELPSISYEKGTSAANTVEEENTYYEYITVGKGRNRKMVVEETQTESVQTQTRHTLALKPQKKNAICFASMWDMHDTYNRLANERKAPQPDEMVLFQSAAPTKLRKKKGTVAVSTQSKGKIFEDIALTPDFLDAALVTERVLASLEYGEAQKVFRGLVDMDPLSLDLVYVYTMRLLWTFECAETANRPIVSITFNPKNKNIIAAAHGKYAYADYCQGMVCIWCSKNPCKPERLYRFEAPVTSVSFSTINANWLACGFWNGDVIILDITSHTIKTVAKSHRDTNPSFDPIWVASWRAVDGKMEYVMTCCQDGRINKFTNTKTGELMCTPMMRVAAVEGKLKGLETAKTCLKVDVPITRYPGVLCLMWHRKIEHIYYVGTEEGCVHKCSTHYLNQHIDVFRAHAGPVYDIGLCPFNDRLYVTSGADGAVRLWIDGIDEVIMTLPCQGAVYGVAFCPKNATILISVSENTMSIWDLRRKNHVPCAEYKFASDVVLTYVHFSKTGDNVHLCDTFGKVYTFHMEDTPIAPFDQSKLLDEVIRNALSTRPQVLKQLDKLNLKKM